MRVLLVAILLCMGLGVGYAKADKIYNKQAKNIAERFKSDLFGEKYTSDADIRELLRKFNTEDQKNAKLYLTGEVFLTKIGDEFLDEMLQKSTETGREIKYIEENRNDAKYMVWWLDRGELDDDEKCTFNEKHRRRACYYPDGFEEFEITISDKYNVGVQINRELIYIKEDKNTNMRNEIEFRISTTENASKPNPGNYMKQAFVEISGYEQEYNRIQQWRNDYVSDIKNGFFAWPNKRRDRETESKSCGKVYDEKKKKFVIRPGCKFYNIDVQNPKWKSTTIPGGAVFLDTIESSTTFTQ